jgi:hypothetical protein
MVLLPCLVWLKTALLPIFSKLHRNWLFLSGANPNSQPNCHQFVTRGLWLPCMQHSAGNSACVPDRFPQRIQSTHALWHHEFVRRGERSTTLLVETGPFWFLAVLKGGKEAGIGLPAKPGAEY